MLGDPASLGRGRAFHVRPKNKAEDRVDRSLKGNRSPRACPDAVRGGSVPHGERRQQQGGGIWVDRRPIPQCGRAIFEDAAFPGRGEDLSRFATGQRALYAAGAGIKPSEANILLADARAQSGLWKRILPGHLEAEASVVRVRTAIKADRVSDGGIESRVVGERGIDARFDLGPCAAQIGTEWDKPSCG